MKAIGLGRSTFGLCKCFYFAVPDWSVFNGVFCAVPGWSVFLILFLQYLWYLLGVCLSFYSCST